MPCSALPAAASLTVTSWCSPPCWPPRSCCGWVGRPALAGVQAAARLVLALCAGGDGSLLANPHHALHRSPLLAFLPTAQSGTIDPRELEHLLRWPRAAAPPPMSDELQAWMGEAQWAGLASLAQLSTFAGLVKVRGRGGGVCIGSVGQMAYGQPWLWTHCSWSLPVNGCLCRHHPILQDVEKSCEDWQRWAESEAPEATPMPGEGCGVHLRRRWL